MSVSTYHCCSVFADSFQSVKGLCLPVDGLEDLAHGSLGQGQLIQLKLFEAFKALAVPMFQNGNGLPGRNGWRKIFPVIHIL